MLKHTLVVSPIAKADLKDIYEYGLQHWGQKKADQYLEALKQHLWLLTEQPLIGVERPDLLPTVRCLPIETHNMFYRVRTNTIEVIRVLHGRQDPLRHLK